MTGRLRWRDLPAVLWRGTMVFLRDLPGYLLAGALLFGTCYAIVGLLRAGLVGLFWYYTLSIALLGMALAWWPAVIASGMVERAGGDGAEAVVLLDSVTDRPFRLLGLGLLSAGFAVVVVFGAYVGYRAIGGSDGSFPGDVLLFLVFGPHALLAAIMVRERRGPLSAVRRFFVLWRGHRLAALGLVAVAGLCGGQLCAGLEIATTELAPNWVLVWIDHVAVLLCLSLVAAWVTAGYLRLSSIEESRLTQSLVDHFD